MKKIIGIIFVSLMFVNNGFAEISLIEEKLVKSPIQERWIATVCIDGYKFVQIGTGPKGRAQSIVQFYEAGNNQSPIPAKC